ncbi:branched-chain amino acid transaminase [bacterium]|jgi:branched-chain amino acid aminotransferase|nr:branched-chain amino acid transaminase [bacterium]MBT3850466.1 branched-chain amino acid transaminase [bacterium]MBT4434932.1 branched-chain amino acid transaminase [bacterium]|tara:strand:+ start:640 stop:1551 length:912 start_codon:yes stop_codon:yes gene_type:complete
MKKSQYIWYNGKFVNWDKATTHVLSHGLHYGSGIFEGIRAYSDNANAFIFRLEDHYSRFYNSGKVSLIKIPFSQKKLQEATVQLIKKNKLKNCYIRPLAFIGEGSIGINPGNNKVNVIIAAFEWGTYLGKNGIEHGIRAKISSFARMGVNSFMTKSKISGNYINSVFAKREAIQLGFDEAIMLDNDGYIAEGTGENIYIVRNNIIKTTPITTVLEGITRDCVIKIAKDNNIEVQEQKFTRDELYISDEVFLSGTAAEITPVREVDDRTIGNGKPGKITKLIQDEYSKIVSNKNPLYASWLTKV